MDKAVQGNFFRRGALSKRRQETRMTDIRRVASPRHRLKAVRIIKARPRLFASVIVGFLVFLAMLLVDVKPAARLLLAWDVGVALYLVLAWKVMASADLRHIRRQARIQDEGQAAILAMTGVA